MKIVTVLTTRGLIYAKTIKGLLDNVIRNGCGLVIIDDQPMPDCFNEGIKQAMSMGASHIWMVEEDNELPPEILEIMASKAAVYDVVTMDYPVNTKGVSHVHRDKDGKVMWLGLGCTLISRKVFEKIPYPWFEVDKKIDMKTMEVVQLPKDRISKDYGGHDVLFFYQKTKPLNLNICVLDGYRGKHFRAKEIPKLEHNEGRYTIHSIEEKEKNV